MPQKIVLITGATGFIGSALAAYFFTKGMHIRALTRNSTHPDIKKFPQYEWIVDDLTKPGLFTDLCVNVDYVLHAAGYAHASKTSNAEFSKKHDVMNFQATVRLAELASQSHVKRFIFFSSVKAVAECNHMIDETWLAFPADPYGISKRKAEDYLLAMSANAKLDVIILRLSLVYGVGWKGNLQSMLKAIEKKRMPLIPKINNRKSMVALQDVCRAADCAIKATPKTNRVFILTDGVTYSTYEIAQMMRTALGYQKTNCALPLWLWRFMGKLGDAIQKIIHRHLPINSETIEKLFGSTDYTSYCIRDELEFVPQHQFSDTISEIVAVSRQH